MTSASAEVVLIAGDTNQQRVYWAGELGLLSDPEFKVVYVTKPTGLMTITSIKELFVVGPGVSPLVRDVVIEAEAKGMVVHYFGKGVTVMGTKPLVAGKKFPPLTGKNAKITLPSGAVVNINSVGGGKSLTNNMLLDAMKKMEEGHPVPKSLLGFPIVPSGGNERCSKPIPQLGIPNIKLDKSFA